MNTAFLLMAQYGGKAIIPIEQVCRDYFSHLTTPKLVQKISAGEIAIRYEYRAALVRLGIIPRDYPRPDVLDRRERAQGFEPKYCPQP